MGSPPLLSARRGITARLLAALSASTLVIALAPTSSAVAADDDVSVYVTFEGYTLGQGYYVEPRKVTLPAGTTAAEATMQVLDATDHDVSPDPGDPTSGSWYLQGVKGFDTGEVNVPSYIRDKQGFALTGTDGDDFLGTPDYNSMSGWMYTIDDVAGDVGAGSKALQDGDVLRWHFTLHGYGCDLGIASACYGSEPYTTQVDKSDLIRAIVDADDATATDDEVADAQAVAVNPTATSTQVADAIDALETADEASSAAWIEVTTTSSGQVLSKVQERLREDYGQSASAYDYSVVQKLRVSGTVSTADYTAIRNRSTIGATITHLDLSGVTTAGALQGMTALQQVWLPSAASITTQSMLQGASSLTSVTVSAATTTFGVSSSTAVGLFGSVTTLREVRFLSKKAPSVPAHLFKGSNNDDPDNRVVRALVPDKSIGGYRNESFASLFSSVEDATPNPAATTEERAGLVELIDHVDGLERSEQMTDERWNRLTAALEAARPVAADAAATLGAIDEVQRELQAALSGLLGMAFIVPAGAEVGVYRKTGGHFAAFTSYPLTKSAQLSTSARDVYVPTTPLANASYHVTAQIKGKTDKVVRMITVADSSAHAQYELELTDLKGREESPLLIPGFGAGDVRGLYTNTDDTGVVNLSVGQKFNLDTFRTVQAQTDQINNYFVEPDFNFDVTGDSVETAEIGAEGRRQLQIQATEPGVSVIKVTYDPLTHVAANGTVTKFNGIDPQATGVVVVNVGPKATFDTGITVRNDLDTFYFDRELGYREFSFKPADGTSVRVHDPLNVSAWNTGWTSYDPDDEGTFTVRLKGGRNVIELKRGDEVTYRVVRAKGVDVSVANNTRSGEDFEPGDAARISITGIEGGIEKMAGIYNPGYGNPPKLTYSDGAKSVSSQASGQYTAVTTTFTLQYTVSEADATLGGYLTIGGMGSPWGYHREIPLTGKPANMNAESIGPFQVGSLPPLYVYDGAVTTEPKQPAGRVPAAPAEPQVNEATTKAKQAAASWLARELDANDDVLARGGSTDWGLTIDALFALAGAHVGGEQIEQTARELYASGDAYVGAQTASAFNWPYVAKTVLALQIAGLDPTTFPADEGARDLETELRSALNADGTWTNAADSFKTSLGVLALARTERGVPERAVRRLMAGACNELTHPNYGAFGYGLGCQSADVDTTSMVLQALVAAGVSEQDPVIMRAGAWIQDQQAEDGGFNSSFGVANTNTAGLGAQALFASGRDEAARQAATFVQELQLTCEAIEGADADLGQAIGAIAYDESAWDETLEYGIDDVNRDQWRRATAQATLGLGVTSLGFVTADDADTPVLPGGCAKPEAATTVSAKASAATYGKASTVAVTVSADSGKPSGTVSTSVGAKTVSARLTEGKATLTLPARSLKPGTRAIRVSYQGADGAYLASKTTVNVKVAKAKASVSVSKPKSVKRSKTASVTVRVSASGVRPTGKVTVKIAGKSKTVRLNSAGRATAKVKVSKSTSTGSRAVSVTYRGDSLVSSASARTKITVKR